ncbi:MAG TPA: hypothetical protein DEB17_02595 [Chlorobaculum sp.]|uniref:Uncharacterized protein n=1 Tax=Chlorobaculum tepidum (strain ATCC 49652 / DSM 12025 / NBRC 103806 / TLS) TaxID=194439 RepID=Q8KEG1_CHLTE|nr:hypothetical protein CT0728 [Chlorobaculum tepidum TLS]HBU22885.1 hypothetical protein [Chlorobaculum sp.]
MQKIQDFSFFPCLFHYDVTMIFYRTKARKHNTTCKNAISPIT